ncbi:MAG: MBL fold metallo-hydrolase [Acidibacillus sp.]|uniref:Hydroxyacylglutathione hydrolase n=1 Tax=Sulfoacidibacillus ferrooxidans TaxID=2005001 RepID=A0A9X1V9T2_9BACL|nr:MBL fold metallo-hydrolase [Sulfoacidibacillus ferrooxidans]MCI0183737.1 Hydroxyacylglutathione hydrolase [Sulfoacidibacillus ferrooxidans]MCY0892225.1 MBL fold metallo-hydrolase [Acidibacillus sp.]
MEISPRVHLLEETKGSYAYVIVGEEPVLVDTFFPGKSDRVVAGLARIGMRPSDLAHIVLTHSDVDHIGNAKRLKELSGATLWAPQEELPYIYKQEKDHGIRRIIRAIMKVEQPVIDETYDAGKRIADLEIIPTPGHTKGHVSIRLGDVLIAGDLVTTRQGKLKPSPGFLTWDRAALQRSLRAVGKQPFDWICPAHGEPVRRGDLWDAFSR